MIEYCPIAVLHPTEGDAVVVVDDDMVFGFETILGGVTCILELELHMGSVGGMHELKGADEGAIGTPFSGVTCSLAFLFAAEPMEQTQI
jgi:hypothetical protein